MSAGNVTREIWDNAPELRDSVRVQLINWAWHYAGGLPNLGHYDSQPFTTPPLRERARPPEWLGPEDAELVERVLVWGIDAPTDGERTLADLRARVYPVFHVQIIRFEYLLAQHLPQRGRADKLGMARRTYLRRVDDAEFWFFCAQKDYLRGGGNRLGEMHQKA